MKALIGSAICLENNWIKLSEYQSNIRMNTESKYGESKDLEKMARLTSEIVNQ